MNNIIVPIDFSECADNALYMASSIARKVKAKLHLVHTLNMADSVLLDAEDDAVRAAPYIKAMEKKFETYVNKPFLKDLEVNYSVRQSVIHQEIDEIINEVNADLIVMGSHGTNGFHEFFIGSTTQKVVRNSMVPVMVIKEKMEGFVIEKAVFACDFAEESIAPYNVAKAFFKKLEIEMKLLYVNTPGSFKNSIEMQKSFDTFFEKAEESGTKKVTIHNDYNVEDGISAFCKLEGANFIGIPTHGRKGLSHIFTGSLGEHIVNHSKYPVITFKI